MRRDGAQRLGGRKGALASAVGAVGLRIDKREEIAPAGGKLRRSRKFEPSVRKKTDVIQNGFRIICEMSFESFLGALMSFKLPFVYNV